jgi:hypothetical protein
LHRHECKISRAPPRFSASTAARAPGRSFNVAPVPSASVPSKSTANVITFFPYKFVDLHEK